MGTCSENLVIDARLPALLGSCGKPQTICPILTARDSHHRLARMPEIQWQHAAEDGAPSICVRPQVGYQMITGFGGAFTEAAATVLMKLPVAAQEEILHAYFDPSHGHGYTLCRTHMNSCDFSLGNYGHADAADDWNLRHFSIAHDHGALLPMIQRASRIAGSPIKLFASPWSPPAWMKTTNRMNRGGKLRKECRQVWADCYARFIQEYEREGIAIWGLTVQNEPAADQKWESCLYTAEEERDFVREHLGPTLHKARLGHVKLMVWDHNRDFLFERAQVILDDADAAAYVWGVGFHWYVFDCFDNVQRVHDAWPDKHLIFTEGCQENGAHDGSWQTGERYARSMIADLGRWTEGWVDWNLLLDTTGGPNHAGNLCSAPILADTATGKIHFQSSYYYIGHFSRFIRPGAQRILCASSHDQLEVLAARNLDGFIAVVVMNRSEAPITYWLKQAGYGAQTTIPAHAIQTLVYRP